MGTFATARPAGGSCGLVASAGVWPYMTASGVQRVCACLTWSCVVSALSVGTGVGMTPRAHLLVLGVGVPSPSSLHTHHPAYYRMFNPPWEGSQGPSCSTARLLSS